MSDVPLTNKSRPVRHPTTMCPCHMRRKRGGPTHNYRFVVRSCKQRQVHTLWQGKGKKESSMPHGSSQSSCDHPAPASDSTAHAGCNREPPAAPALRIHTSSSFMACGMWPLSRACESRRFPAHTHRLPPSFYSSTSISSHRHRRLPSQPRVLGGRLRDWPKRVEMGELRGARLPY